jgi:hypothetical protein
MRIRANGRMLLGAAIVMAPIMLVWCVWTFVTVPLRALFRVVYGHKRNARRRANEAIKAHQVQPSGEYVQAVRDLATRAAKDALDRGNRDQLIRAWKVLDENGGDY